MTDLCKLYNLKIVCPVCDLPIDIFEVTPYAWEGLEVKAHCPRCKILEYIGFSATQAALSETKSLLRVELLIKVVQQFMIKALKVKLFFVNLNKEWRMCEECRQKLAEYKPTEPNLLCPECRRAKVEEL